MSENEFFDTLQDFEIIDFSSDNYESLDLDDYLGGFIRWINPPSKKTNWLIKEYHSTCILMNIQLNMMLKYKNILLHILWGHNFGYIFLKIKNHMVIIVGNLIVSILIH